MFDHDENGKIGFKDLERVAKELGENLTDEELQEMIDEADLDHDGEINEQEFIRIMKKLCTTIAFVIFPSLLPPSGSDKASSKLSFLFEVLSVIRVNKNFDF